MLTKVKKAYKSGVRFPINFDIRTDKAYGEHVGDFRGYLALQDRSKVSILIDNWHDVDSDLKDSIWADITIFIMNFIICFTSIWPFILLV